MSAHVTEVVPHDHINCHTSRHAESGDCGTRFEARCSCGWAQGASSRAIAEAIAVGHRGYSPDAPVIITANIQGDAITADQLRDVFARPAMIFPADIPQGGAITNDQLRDLFARHCACRPLDLTRGESDHAAIHDCDTGILHDVQIALGIVRFDDIGRVQAMREARKRCAEIFQATRNPRGGWNMPSPKGDAPVTLDDIAQKIYEERYVDPKDPETAAYMRDGMIREVAQRTLELVIGSIPVDVIATLITTRRDRDHAHAAVTAWMKETRDRGDLVQADRSPGWDAYHRAEEAWHSAIEALDAALCTKEPAP